MEYDMIAEGYLTVNYMSSQNQTNTVCRVNGGRRIRQHHYHGRLLRHGHNDHHHHYHHSRLGYAGWVMVMVSISILLDTDFVLIPQICCAEEVMEIEQRGQANVEQQQQPQYHLEDQQKQNDDDHIDSVVEPHVASEHATSISDNDNDDERANVNHVETLEHSSGDESDDDNSNDGEDDDYRNVYSDEITRNSSFTDEDAGDETHDAVEEEEEQDDEQQQQHHDKEEHEDDNPVHTVTNLDQLGELVRVIRSQYAPTMDANTAIRPQFVVLAYREDCEESMQQLWTYQFAVREIMSKVEKTNPEFLTWRLRPVFVQLLINESTIEVLESYGIKTVPSLFFVKEQETASIDDSNAGTERGMFYAVQYRGIVSNVKELVDGMLHYLFRIRHSRISQRTNTVNDRSYQDALTVYVRSFNDLQDDIFTTNGNNILRKSPPMPLDPHLSEEEDEWIRYLMDDIGAVVHDDNVSSKDGDLHVICQCRHYDVNNDDEASDPPRDKKDDGDVSNGPVSSSSSLNLTLYSEFDLVSHVLSARRDVLFCVLSGNCSYDGEDPIDDGSIAAFTVSPDTSWVLQKKRLLLPSDGKNFTDWVNPMLRPDVLWLDRRMTAPILFHQQYGLHAVLFVDFHDRTTREVMRDAIRIFRAECQHQREQYGDDSMVCLVVPSTDTRMLITFGIDIWTPMDIFATKIISDAKCQNGHEGVECKEELDDMQEKQNDILSPPAPVLPTLLLTNRRPDVSGIERYYLDPPITMESLIKFMTDFRLGNATPDINSSRRTSVSTNDHGIHVLSGHTLPSFLEEHKQDHVLLQLYAPSCGHCKRFNTIWNGLGDLLGYLGWTDRLVLARMDITTNEFFVPGLKPSWLPDMFYFGLGVTENPIRYDQTKTGREAPLGAFSDPLDVIDWWLDQAGESVDQQALLDDLAGESLN
jgi:hypothetical protein